MNKLVVKISLITLLSVLASFSSFSQDTWSPIPYFTGNNSHVYIRETGNGPDADVWVNNRDFSIDLWIKCDFSTGTARDGEIFTIFGAGEESEYNSPKVGAFIVYFVKNPTIYYNQHDDWRLRVDYWTSDTELSQFSQAECTYSYTDFDDTFTGQWVHIHVGFDHRSDRWDNNVSLWVNGSKDINEEYFRFEEMTRTSVVLGGHVMDHSEDFKGHIGSLRL